MKGFSHSSHLRGFDLGEFDPFNGKKIMQNRAKEGHYGAKECPSFAPFCIILSPLMEKEIMQKGAKECHSFEPYNGRKK